MTQLSPFQLTVYTRAFQRVGWIGAPLAVELVPRHLATGYCKVTVPSDDLRVPYLTEPGARMTVDYLGDRVMSGRVSRVEGAGPLAEGTVAVTIDDDFRLLERLLGWPNPAGDITQQGAATAYHTVTGPAETVLKTIVSANRARSTPPVTVAGDAGRGARVTATMRMHPVADRLLTLLDTAGVGVTVRQEGAGLVVDCYAPTVRSQPISETSGVLVDWSYTMQAPAATRVVVGGQGEGTAREFVSVVDTAREQLWGESIEVFRDARDSDDPTVQAERAQETLAEGAPTTGLTLTLAETPGYRYGKSVRVGDTVTVDVAPGVSVTDTLHEARITWDTQDGLQVTPVVGERSDDPAVTLRRTITSLARSIRDMKAR